MADISELDSNTVPSVVLPSQLESVPEVVQPDDETYLMVAVQATKENWKALHRKYLAIAGGLQKSPTSYAKGDRKAALLLASEVMAPHVISTVTNKAFTPEEYRKWSMKTMSSFKSPENGSKKPKATRKSVLKISKPDVQKETNKPVSMTERAEKMFRGLKTGQTRLEVLLDAADVKRYQQSLSHAAGQRKWPRGTYRSAVVEEEVHQAGETRVIVAVKKMR